MTISSSSLGDVTDNGCDCIDGEDADEDQVASVESGGGDCDDDDPWVHPGAPDLVDPPDGSWREDEVEPALDGQLGAHFDLELDAAGHAHLCYVDTSEGALRYATNGSGLLAYETLDTGLDEAARCDLEVDATGAVHVAYRVLAEAERWHAVLTEGEWLLRRVEAQPGGALSFPALDVESEGTVHVAFYRQEQPQGAGSLAYATDGSGVFANQTIDAQDDTGAYADLVVGATGTVHVSYATLSGPKALRYAQKIDGAWQVEAVGDRTGQGNDLFVGPEGFAHIAFSGSTREDPVYATNRGGDWSVVRVDSARDPVDTSVLVRASGEVNVLTWHDTWDQGDELRLHRLGADGRFEAVAVQSSPRLSAVALREDGAGHRHVAYADRSLGAIRYLRELPALGDSDCDGVDGVDGDQDGHASEASGGSDCDDGDAQVHPLAPEVAGDGVDSNCTAGDDD